MFNKERAPRNLLMVLISKEPILMAKRKELATFAMPTIPFTMEIFMKIESKGKADL